MKYTGFKNPHSQVGVSLVEVMVAAVILAIGMLGIAALQAVTLRNSGSAASRTQATIQVYSMMDIIRTDRNNVTAYNTNTFVDGTGDVGSMNGWLGGLKTSVAPDAKGRVVCEAAQMTCTVGVQWNDARATGGDSLQTIEFTSQI